MRISLAGLFTSFPFDRVLEHSTKVAEGGPIFLRAVESYFKGDREDFEIMKEEIRDIEAEADKIKQNIRAHLPPAMVMPFDKSLFFSFLKEADKIIDCMKNALYWMSYFPISIPEDVEKEYVLLVRSAADFLGFFPEMVTRADTYFRSRQETDRLAVKEIIKEIRFREQSSDDVEKTMLIRLCKDDVVPPKTFFVVVRLVETTGDIADHLENSADMMRAMIAR
jgi:predicted phosphate transport protein (TIGR00153 family)